MTLRLNVRPEGGALPPRVSFWTHGCRLNQHDTATMRAELEAEGWRVVPADADADWIVVNTCTVTAEADRQARQLIRRLARRRPRARIAVTGCYAQRAPRELEGIHGVQAVLGVSEREHVVHSLRAASASGGSRVGAARAKRPFAPATPLRFGRTRALLKVQDGCDAFCAYCIVPYVRGRARSLPVESAVDQARRLLDAGFDELVVTGADLGRYGRDLVGRPLLGQLVDRLLALGSRHRVRLSSIEPNSFEPALVDRIGSHPGLCRHVHLPLQSGSRAVLSAMRRAYTPEAYRALVERIAARGRVGIGTDVMVGFPGEGAAEFEETRALLEELPITYFHVFRYSPRPGTLAAKIDGIPRVDRTVRERAEVLRLLGERKRQSFFRSLLGETLQVVAEQRRRDGAAVAMSDLYAPIRLTQEPPWRGIGAVRVVGAAADMLIGEPFGAMSNSDPAAARVDPM